MTGQVLLGLLAVFLMLWFGLSALTATAHAFPFRPSLLLPGRSRSAAILLIWVIVLTLGAAALLTPPHWTAFVPFGLILVLPLWDSVSASGFRHSLIVLNGETGAVRPAIVHALETFFGPVEEDGDTLRSAEKDAEAFRIDSIEGRRLVVLSPTFILQPKRKHALEKLLKEALRSVPASGFNPMVLGVAVLLPLVIAGAFGWMGMMLLTTQP